MPDFNNELQFRNIVTQPEYTVSPSAVDDGSDYGLFAQGSQAAALQAAINALGSSGGSIKLLPGFNSGTTTITISQPNIAILGQSAGNQDTASATIQSIQFGVSGGSAKVSNIHTDNLTFYEMLFFNYQLVETSDFHNTTIITKAANPGSGIVFDGTKGTNQFQYLTFSGQTYIFDNNDSNSTTTYPGQVIFINGGTNSNSHLSFEDINILHNGTLTGIARDIRYGPGAAFNTIRISKIDDNQSGTTSTGYHILEVDANATATSTIGSVNIGLCRFETHTGTNYVENIGAFTSTGKMNVDLHINTLEFSGTTGSICNNANTLFAGSGTSGLQIDAVHPLGTAATIGVGTFGEVATFPYYIGNFPIATGPLGTGTTIANPLTGTASNSIISVGGTVATTSWVSGNTYICGGTPVIVYISGGSGVTVTITSSSGTAVLSGATVIADGYYLSFGMTIAISWTTAPTITVVKAT
jgi:hypothetical protein